jgi:L-asparaginase / beta-aspartyl-peptidase
MHTQDVLPQGDTDTTAAPQVAPSTASVRFVLHGGAGVIDRASLTPAKEAQFRAELARITQAATAKLLAGGSALDVVEFAICELENFPLFNAGHGAVLNANGEVELDASIMDGRTRACGAVAAAKTPMHPITLARAVMEQTEHVLIVGQGADLLAERLGVAPLAYFITAERAEQQRQAALLGKVTLDHDSIFNPNDKKGTVGACARDQWCNLAAGTSTGGMTNKMPGRCGDTPMIGAGTWADNATLAVSATGHGEYFIRNNVCFDLHAQMAYGGKSVAQASGATFARLDAMGGTGGVICIDAQGGVTMPFNSEGMYRGWFDGQASFVAIYAD